MSHERNDRDGVEEPARWAELIIGVAIGGLIYVLIKAAILFFAAP